MARYHEQPKAAALARATAVRRLIANHAVEFEQIHAEERKSRGLDKRPVACPFCNRSLADHKTAERRVTGTARIERAVELLREAQARLGVKGHAYLLVDAAVTKLHEELADRMLEDASAEIAGMVDIHGLIDDVAGDDRAQGFQ